MSIITWSTLAVGIILLITAKFSVIRMSQEINHGRNPQEWITLAWWPNYKDRRVMKIYHSLFPQGRLNILYVSCIASGVCLLLLAVIFASHSQI